MTPNLVLKFTAFSERSDKCTFLRLLAPNQLQKGNYGLIYMKKGNYKPIFMKKGNYEPIFMKKVTLIRGSLIIKVWTYLDEPKYGQFLSI